MSTGHDPLISVIIDTYNYGIYIEDAIVSAINQTLPSESYEIIVVDDGSTDDTRQRVEKYLPGIIYHYKENGGQASAFNAGLSLARGEFIAFLDADDYWEPEKLRIVLEKFRTEQSVDVVYHTLCLVDETKRKRGIFPQWFAQIVVDKPVENYRNGLTAICSATSGITWRKSALLKLCPIPEVYRICADGYLMVSAPVVAREFGLIDRPLALYRIHGENGFSTFDSSGDLMQVKSQEISTYYNRLFVEHLTLLADKLNFQEIGLIKELTRIIFKDVLLETRERSGLFNALKALWEGRSLLADLSCKYRLFRFASITLQLLTPHRLYLKMHQRYINSPLWFLVQRYIKDNASIPAANSGTSGDGAPKMNDLS